MGAATQQQRVSQNEATSRHINEAIEERLWSGEKRSAKTFLCECGRTDCNHVVHITPREYETVRANPRRFVVYPGHQIPELETIVDAQGGYLVVEKEGEAGQVAEASDPRR